MRPRALPLLLVVAAGCAQPQSPPGGDIDTDAPRVVEVVPAPFDTLVDPDRPLIIRFNERISQRLEGVAELEDAVLVSPATGEVRVDQDRRALEVSVEGGWRPGTVYRVVVLPVLRDLFQNQRLEPIEVVFSTGGTIEETAVAGFVMDRLTGEPAPDARVRATHLSSDLAYSDLADSTGFFALRYVPAGDHSMQAWLDQDRDLEADFREPQDTARFSMGPGDTVVVELPLLPGDTGAARLAIAEPVDSMTIELLFDDYFAVAPVTGGARVLSLPDSALVAVGPLTHPALAGTGLPSPGQREQRERPAGAGAAAGEAADSLPSRTLLLTLDRPLPPDSVYLVTVDGVTNIHGIPGGGGSAELRMPPQPEPESDAPESDAPESDVPESDVPESDAASSSATAGSQPQSDQSG